MGGDAWAESRTRPTSNDSEHCSKPNPEPRRSRPTPGPYVMRYGQVDAAVVHCCEADARKLVGTMVARRCGRR